MAQRLYAECVVGNAVRVTKETSIIKGVDGIVVDVNSYEDMADWYLVSFPEGTFPNDADGRSNQTMWFRASDVVKL